MKYHQCATIHQTHSSIDKARHIRTRPGWKGEQLLVEQTIYPTINDVTVSNILDLLWDIVSVIGALVRQLSHCQVQNKLVDHSITSGKQIQATRDCWQLIFCNGLLICRCVDVVSMACNSCYVEVVYIKKSHEFLMMFNPIQFIEAHRTFKALVGSIIAHNELCSYQLVVIKC